MPNKPRAITWAYGVTTVPSRLNLLLPQTLASLAAGGFERPRLFIDGTEMPDLWKRFGLEVTSRYPPLRTFANWSLALAELWARNPLADRYALFQDDFLCVRNLRQYLERCRFPVKGYWNLYTMPQNEGLATQPRPKEMGRWFVSNQRGLGAVGLVFSSEGVKALLGHPDMIRKPVCPNRGWRNLDGAIVNAMSHRLGWLEHCHSPSLLQHTGIDSSMVDFAPGEPKKNQPLALSFPGERFDALTLLEKPC